MYLSKLELKPEAASNREFWSGLQDVYGAHQAIWQLFSDGPGRKRDFLFRKEGEGAGSRWYAMSDRKPHDGRGFWTVTSKEFDPRIVVGDRLHFLVRVNPTVAKAISKTKSVRHDVVMNAKHALPVGERAREESRIISEACATWIQKREAFHGLEIDPGTLGTDGYRQLGSPKSKGIRISTIDIEGILTVRDVERFTQMLFHGLGPAKSFGCGLMLIRRA